MKIIEADLVDWEPLRIRFMPKSRFADVCPVEMTIHFLSVGKAARCRVAKVINAGVQIEEFFDSLSNAVEPLARSLRALIRRAIPEASESIKWGMPVYETGRLVCAIRPAADYVALQFYGMGTSLSDPDGLLEGNGKRMRHVKIRSQADIRNDLFTRWIRQAAE